MRMKIAAGFDDFLNCAAGIGNVRNHIGMRHNFLFEIHTIRGGALLGIALSVFGEDRDSRPEERSWCMTDDGHAGA